jgi:hypothetical protein
VGADLETIFGGVFFNLILRSEMHSGVLGVFPWVTLVSILLMIQSRLRHF